MVKGWTIRKVRGLGNCIFLPAKVEITFFHLGLGISFYETKARQKYIFWGLTPTTPPCDHFSNGPCLNRYWCKHCYSVISKWSDILVKGWNFTWPVKQAPLFSSDCCWLIGPSFTGLLKSFQLLQRQIVCTFLLWNDLPSLGNTHILFNLWGATPHLVLDPEPPKMKLEHFWKVRELVSLSSFC